MNTQSKLSTFEIFAIELLFTTGTLLVFCSIFVFDDYLNTFMRTVMFLLGVVTNASGLLAFNTKTEFLKALAK